MPRRRRDAEVFVLKLPTPEGPMRVEVAVPDGELGLSALVPAAQRLTDAMVERALAVERKEGRPLSCKAGCGACCRQLVPVSAPEALLLAERIVALPEPAQSELLGRFDGAVDALGRAGLVERLDALSSAPGSTDMAALARDYFALGLACPVLLDESCSLHPARPISCRDYCVTSPAEHCRRPSLGLVRKVPTPAILSEPLARATARLVGGPPVLVPLATAMRWVDEHAELGFRTFPARELFHALLLELGVPPAKLAEP
ncbi:MAG: YkgJ family cysteine cluster protein [Myxococcales bacterium]|nr:YkgJ family cysteine cluster protein [Myxococcales bacterium]